MKIWTFRAVPLILAGMMLSVGAAKAQTTVNPGDVFLAVEDTSDTITTDYEIDLGNISVFEGYNSSDAGTIAIVNLNADLETAFGSNYLSNTNLEYGIVGTTGASSVSGLPANTIFLSNPELINGVPNAPFISSSDVTQGTYRSNIEDFETGPTQSGFSGQSSNGTVAPDATIVAASGANSYTSQEAGSGFGTGYSDLNELSGVSDLDVNTPGFGDPGSVIGSFSINDSGELLFTSENAAVPEPSTYVLMSMGFLALFWRLRRRASFPS